MRFERLMFVAVAVAATWGCRDLFAPPPGSRAFDPPRVYRNLWQEVEDCSGLLGDFDRVRWFVVPESFFWCGDETCAGLWRSPHDVYLSEVAQSDSGGHYFTVRHEMLHDLLAGGADHPPVFSGCGLRRPWAVGAEPRLALGGRQPRAGELTSRWNPRHLGTLTPQFAEADCPQRRAVARLATASRKSMESAADNARSAAGDGPRASGSPGAGRRQRR